MTVPRPSKLIAGPKHVIPGDPHKNSCSQSEGSRSISWSNKVSPSHMAQDTDLRYRHREGLGDLHQYVIEEDPIRVKPVMQQSQKGPKVINLDDR